MSYALGVDIGASSMAAAIARPVADRPPASERVALGERPLAPSAAFLGDDGRVLIGEAAERHGLVRPERLVRDFTARVGDTVPIVVGTRRIMAEDLFARAVQWIVDRATSEMGSAPASVAVGTSTKWGDGTIALVQQALADRGLHGVSMTDGAVAAFLHHIADLGIDSAGTTVVYDLGATRLDVSVVTVSDGAVHRVATERVERQGGSWFDDLVVRYVIARADGAFVDFDGSDPGAGLALAELRRRCVEAKETLSDEDQATIHVRMPAADCGVRLSRECFEGLVENAVSDTGDAVRRALSAVDAVEADAATLLLVGGSSRIPLIGRRLFTQLGRAITLSSDPEGAVARGTAIAAARRLHGELEESAPDAAEAPPVDIDAGLRVGIPWRRRPSASRPAPKRRTSDRSVTAASGGAAVLGEERRTEIVGATPASDRREATG